MYQGRIVKELAEAKKFKEPNILLCNLNDDVYTWKGYLFGPNDSPFKEGIFEIRLNLPKNYPMSPPKITFITKIFHPNINFDTGEVCLDILKEQWTPAWTLESACLAILDIMNHPNPDSPLNCDAGNLMRAGDLMGYNQLAHMYTLEHAINKKEYETKLREALAQ